MEETLDPVFDESMPPVITTPIVPQFASEYARIREQLGLAKPPEPEPEPAPSYEDMLLKAQFAQFHQRWQSARNRGLSDPMLLPMPLNDDSLLQAQQGEIPEPWNMARIQGEPEPETEPLSSFDNSQFATASSWEESFAETMPPPITEPVVPLFPSRYPNIREPWNMATDQGKLAPVTEQMPFGQPSPAFQGELMEQQMTSHSKRPIVMLINQQMPNPAFQNPVIPPNRQLEAMNCNYNIYDEVPAEPGIQCTEDLQLPGGSSMQSQVIEQITMSAADSNNPQGQTFTQTTHMVKQDGEQPQIFTDAQVSPGAFGQKSDVGCNGSGMMPIDHFPGIIPQGEALDVNAIGQDAGMMPYQQGSNMMPMPQGSKMMPGQYMHPYGYPSDMEKAMQGLLDVGIPAMGQNQQFVVGMARPVQNRGRNRFASSPSTMDTIAEESSSNRSSQNANMMQGSAGGNQNGMVQGAVGGQVPPEFPGEPEPDDVFEEEGVDGDMLYRQKKKVNVNVYRDDGKVMRGRETETLEIEQVPKTLEGIGERLYGDSTLVYTFVVTRVSKESLILASPDLE